jgi:hypothetical protein
MLKRCSVLLLVAGWAWAQAPAIPDTPAGHALQAWLDAFNSGDRGRIQAYLERYEPKKAIDATMAFRAQTGGFELTDIDKSEPLRIEFRVKEKNRGLAAVGRIEMDTAEPPVVASFSVRAIPPGMTAADLNPKIDAATRARVIDGAIANLNEYYVFPETAKKMEEAVRLHQKKGDYDAVDHGEDFAQRLTADLRAVSHDKHLGVNFSPAVLPKQEPGPNPEAEARMRAQLERSNCFFEKVERRANNIGYIKFNGFANPDVCGATAAAAMNFLAHVDAIIFDMRENGGGDPRMVQLMCSYLLDKSTHLNDLYNRKEDSTTQYWTLPYVPGTRLAGKPAFVLTSKRTFSGAEEFTYNLKELKRATVIGETTGGGAHPVAGHRIDDHFTIGVPFARAVNPVSKTNWEGTGVEPDVKTAADGALEVAEKMAGEEIAKAGNGRR